MGRSSGLTAPGAGRSSAPLVDEAGTAGPIDRYRFDGKTDPQIVQDLLSLAGHAGADNATVIQAVCRRYVDHLRAELERSTQTTRVMAGIADLLTALEPYDADRRALVGLAHGQRRPGSRTQAPIGRARPGAVFASGAYGSDSARRAEPSSGRRRAGDGHSGRDLHGIGRDHRGRHAG